MPPLTEADGVEYKKRKDNDSPIESGFIDIDERSLNLACLVDFVFFYCFKRCHSKTERLQIRR
jgi:hypothetical protein